MYFGVAGCTETTAGAALEENGARSAPDGMAASPGRWVPESNVQAVQHSVCSRGCLPLFLLSPMVDQSPPEGRRKNSILHPDPPGKYLHLHTDFTDGIYFCRPNNLKIHVFPVFAVLQPAGWEFIYAQELKITCISRISRTAASRTGMKKRRPQPPLCVKHPVP